MATFSSSISSPIILSHPPSSFGFSTPKPGVLNRRTSQLVCSCARRDAYGHDFGGRRVDEDMIVLRKRIHETKMVERNYEPPSDWMEWEKRYYTSYDELVCQFVGVLQSFLMNSRPSVALGVVALVTLSVPISTAVVVSRLVEAIHAIFSGVHLS